MGTLKSRPLYTNKLLAYKDNDIVKVITGIRRCGKSSVLELYRRTLISQGIPEDHIIYMNLESLRFVHLTDYIQFYRDVASRIPKSGKCYLMFDEIQQVSQWEKTIESFRIDFDVDIYITGSNAYLLSSELSTYLSGRYVEIRIYPLSFAEYTAFCAFSDDEPLGKKFVSYMRTGGMPILIDCYSDEEKCSQILEGIYSTVVLKDIVQRGGIQNQNLLERIVRFLCQNIGSLTSPNKISNILQSEGDLEKNVARKTITQYLALLENAFIFSSVGRYNIRGRELLRTQEKYYIADLGFRNLLLRTHDTDRGHLLENLVYLELCRRGYSVYVGKTGEYEVDFIAERQDGPIYIQVTESMTSPETVARELRPLRLIRDNYPKYILSMDWDFNTSYDGVLVRNAAEWMIEA